MNGNIKKNIIRTIKFLKFIFTVNKINSKPAKEEEIKNSLEFIRREIL